MADYRVSIGNVEVVSLTDGSMEYDPTEFFPEVPHEVWGSHRSALTPEGRLRTYGGCFALRSQGRTILVDTGYGSGPVEALGGVKGQLDRELKRKGIRPDEVSIVVMTHLHPDHVGWNLTHANSGWKPTFPRARYLVSKGDWEFFRTPQSLAEFPYIRETVMPLLDLGVLELIDGEHTITMEVTTLPTPGHTPGHISVVIASRGQRGLVLGDVAHAPVQAQETDWNSAFEVSPEEARRTRHRVFDRAEQEGSVLMAGHFPPPGIGRLLRSEGRRYWQAL